MQSFRCTVRCLCGPISSPHSSCRYQCQALETDPLKGQTYILTRFACLSSFPEVGFMIGMANEVPLKDSCQCLSMCALLQVGLLKPVGGLEPITADVIFAQCKIASDRSINYKVAPSKNSRLTLPALTFTKLSHCKPLRWALQHSMPQSTSEFNSKGARTSTSLCLFLVFFLQTLNPWVCSVLVTGVL